MLNGKKSIQVKRKHWDKQNTLEGTKLLEFKAWINLSSGQIFKLLLLSIDNVPIF
jgi:hypothetical protein